MLPPISSYVGLVIQFYEFSKWFYAAGISDSLICFMTLPISL